MIETKGAPPAVADAVAPLAVMATGIPRPTVIPARGMVMTVHRVDLTTIPKDLLHQEVKVRMANASLMMAKSVLTRSGMATGALATRSSVSASLAIGNSQIPSQETGRPAPVIAHKADRPDKMGLTEMNGAAGISRFAQGHHGLTMHRALNSDHAAKTLRQLLSNHLPQESA